MYLDMLNTIFVHNKELFYIHIYKKKSIYINSFVENFTTLHQSLIYYTDMADLNRLKVVLVEQKKTGKWLADQLGKSTCTVSKWCSNTVQPDLNTLNKIARLLNIDVKELLNSNN